MGTKLSPEISIDKAIQNIFTHKPKTTQVWRHKTESPGVGEDEFVNNIYIGDFVVLTDESEKKFKKIKFDDAPADLKDKIIGIVVGIDVNGSYKKSYQHVLSDHDDYIAEEHIHIYVVTDLGTPFVQSEVYLHDDNSGTGQRVGLDYDSHAPSGTESVLSDRVRKYGFTNNDELQLVMI